MLPSCYSTRSLGFRAAAHLGPRRELLAAGGWCHPTTRSCGPPDNVATGHHLQVQLFSGLLCKAL
jgi:hypothetical protein